MSSLRGPSKSRFEEIFKNGKMVQQVPFRLIFDSGSGKVGIATAKAIGGKPQRNHVKRQVKSLIRENQNQLSNDQDYVLIVRDSVLQLSFLEMSNAFESLLNRLPKQISGTQEPI